MKTSTLKSFLEIHTWMGLLAGFGLFFAFYAGALTIFKDSLEQWEHGPGGAPRAADVVAAQALVDAGLKQFPEMAPGFHLSFDTAGTPTLGWTGAKAADGQTERALRLVEGRAVAYTAPSELADFVYRLHYTAGLPHTVGTYLMGLVCVLYGLALVSGVVLFAPTLVRDLFQLRAGHNLKRLWQDAHNAIGMVSLPFHALYAWTGALLTVGTLILGLFEVGVFGGRLSKVLEADFTLAPPAVASHRPAPMASVEELVAAARQQSPGFAPTYIGFDHYGDAGARVDVYGLVHGQKQLIPFGAVALRGADARVLRVQEAATMSAGGAFYRGLIALHYGNYAGVALRWAYFGLGLAGAFLFYSGNLLWIERRRKRRQVAQPRRTRLMAQATLGVCLGCVAGISALFLATKLLPPGLTERIAWTHAVYYAVFLGALAWAFARPPARGAVELLWLCAGLTLAVPLAGWAVDGVVPLAAGGTALLGLHATALVLAAAFAGFARVTARRAREGDPHSVWALPAAGGPEPVPPMPSASAS